MSVIRMIDLDLRDKRVLVREDLNVPLENGAITSTQRLEAALPTLRAAREAGARLMVMSHLGRPKEGVWEAAASLAPIAESMARRDLVEHAKHAKVVSVIKSLGGVGATSVVKAALLNELPANVLIDLGARAMAATVPRPN